MDIKDIYEELNGKVNGSLSLAEDRIVWKQPNGLEFRICHEVTDELYVGVYYDNRCITHFHSYMDEILDDIMFMNDRVCWYRKKGLFGLSSPRWIEKEKYDSLSQRKKARYVVLDQLPEQDGH